MTKFCYRYENERILVEIISAINYENYEFLLNKWVQYQESGIRRRDGGDKMLPEVSLRPWETIWHVEFNSVATKHQCSRNSYRLLASSSRDHHHVTPKTLTNCNFI